MDLGRLHEAPPARTRAPAEAGAVGRRRTLGGDHRCRDLRRAGASPLRHGGLPAGSAIRARRGRRRATHAVRQRSHLRRVSPRRPARGSRGPPLRGAPVIAAAAVQLLGGLLLGPLLVGSIQTAKARLQGRRGPSPLQPYRELRRLWGKSAVDPDGAGPLYELAPPLVAAATAIAVLVVPVAGVPSPWGSATTPSSCWRCSRSPASPSRLPPGIRARGSGSWALRVT